MLQPGSYSIVLALNKNKLSLFLNNVLAYLSNRFINESVRFCYPLRRIFVLSYFSWQIYPAQKCNQNVPCYLIVRHNPPPNDDYITRLERVNEGYKYLMYVLLKHNEY